MSRQMVLLGLVRAGRSACLAVAVFCTPVQAASDIESMSPPLMVLAAKLAANDSGASEEWRLGLLQSYQEVYGNIWDVKPEWPAMVRRALTCHAVGDVRCVQSSFEVIDRLGGVEKLPLARLYEISRFNLAPADIAARLAAARDAAAVDVSSESVESPNQPTQATEVAQAPVTDTPTATAPTPPMTVTPTPDASASRPHIYVESALSVLGTLFLFWLTYKVRNWLRSDRGAPAEAVSAEAPVVTPLPEPEASPPENPQLQSARRLLDAMNAAERDVAPFLQLLNGADVHAEQVEVIQRWRESLVQSRDSLLRTFAENAWPVEFIAYDPPRTISEANTRLMNHAAFFCSLLLLQKKQDSSLFFWSRQVPLACMHLWWIGQTRNDIKRLESIAMPLLEVGKAPLTMKDASSNPDEFYSTVVRQANQHGQSTSHG